MGRPQTHHGMAGTERRHRRVAHQLQFADAVTTRQSEADSLTGDRFGIGRVVSPHARLLEPGHIGQVGHRARRLERFDEIGQSFAVARQDPRPRRCLPHEHVGHGAEEFHADQFLYHGEGVGQRVDKRTDHVVSINSQARRRVGAVPGPHTRWAGPARIEQRRRKRCLAAGAGQRHAPPQYMPQRWGSACAAIMSSARPASASRVASAGTSLSRSSSVATGPSRAITSA